MTSIYDVLKANRIGRANDFWTTLVAQNWKASEEVFKEYTGPVPTTIRTDGTPLLLWSISGNMQQTGTPSPSSIITPEETGERTGNLFDATFREGYQLSPSTGKLVEYTNNARCATENPIDVTGINTVTFSFSNLTSENKFFMYSLFNGDTFVERVAAKVSGDTINVSSGTSLYLCVYTSMASINAKQTISNIMLNSGSTAEPYEPYGCKLPVESGGVTTPIYLDEPLRKIGEYADKVEGDTVTRYIKKLVLTGAETWSLNSGVFYTFAISDFLKAEGITCMCSHYPPQNNAVGVAVVQEKHVCFRTSTYNQFYLKDADFDSTDALKSYLAAQYAAGTPVTVWYVLATPTTETITAPTIPTINGSQTFDVDTTLKPSEVYIKYKGR